MRRVVGISSLAAATAVCHWLPCLDHRHGLSGGDDGDALEALEDQEMLAIAGDDQIGLGRLGGGEHRIIVGIC